MKLIRNRYILFDIISDGEVKYQDFRKAFLDTCLRLLGEIEYKNANILILEKDFKNQGIVRCSHKYVDKIKLALALIKEINEQKVILQSIKVSGTIKALKR